MVTSLLVLLSSQSYLQDVEVPAYTGYVVGGHESALEEGKWVSFDKETRLSFGGYARDLAGFGIVLTGRGLTGLPLVTIKQPASGYAKVARGRFHEDGIYFDPASLPSKGWFTFEVSGFSDGQLQTVKLVSTRKENLFFNMKPRRNAASVHIGYPNPGASDRKDEGVEWFYNEVQAVTDPQHSFYMACGFSRGYFGMQVNSGTERRVIFSVWDSGTEADDRNKVADENRVKLLGKGEGVYAGEFGNEGTGGHSHLKIQWETGVRQRFLVRAQKADTATIYTGYYFRPDLNKWMLIASFRAPKDGGLLRGLHSFNENFWGTNGHLKRAAEFGPVWVKSGKDSWKQLKDGVFTHDATGGKDRIDYDLKAIGNRWLLQNGGFEGASPAYRSTVTVAEEKQAPKIDFSDLPVPGSVQNR